jgi:hypothetical protein
MNTQELFEDFDSHTTMSRIVKSWSVTYEGIEYKGVVITTLEAWGSWRDNEFTIDDQKDLTDDELDNLKDYVMDNI